MTKSKKQPEKQESKENIEFGDSGEDARFNSDREADIASDSSREGDNEVDREKEDLPLSRPKGMDA